MTSLTAFADRTEVHEIGREYTPAVGYAYCVYDLALVGTGFSSAFFLREYLRTAPKNARVVVLEMAKERSRDASVDFEELIENRTPEKPWLQKIAFGGGSCWWGNVPRPHPTDFALQSTHGLSVDWPLDYEELEPYLCDVEESMGIAGEPHPDFPRSRPYPLPPHALSGFDRAVRKAFPDGLTSMPSARASNPSAGRAACCTNSTCGECPMGAKFEVGAHMSECFDDPRVTLLLGAEARELRVEAGRVRGVVYESAGREHEVDCDFAALGAHAIFNPFICLRSGIDDEHMGRYLSEQTSEQVLLDLDGVDNFDGGQSVSGLLTSFLNRSSRRDYAGSIWELWNTPMLRAEAGRWRQRAMIRVVFETIPQKENRVTYEPGNDKPVVVFEKNCGWAERGKKKVPEMVAEMAKRVPIERWYGSDEHYRRTVSARTEAHIQGTTRMSREPKDGVVDRDLVHHQVRNLALLGSGAFPSCPAANPTLLLSALSVRSARVLFGPSSS